MDMIVVVSIVVEEEGGSTTSALARFDTAKSVGLKVDGEYPTGTTGNLFLLLVSLSSVGGPSTTAATTRDLLYSMDKGVNRRQTVSGDANGIARCYS